MKCDETKPSCIKCQSRQLDCGGYKIPENRSKQALRRVLPMIPRVPASSTTIVPLMPSPPQILFQNEQEFSYFNIFCNTTAGNLGEYLDTTLWSHIVLQASQQESFIRSAVIALGALDKTLDAMTIAEERSGEVQTVSAVHYQIAIQQYGKSIKGIREACKEVQRSKRTILIACLLAVCFEYFYGNIDLAIAHIQNGISLSEYFSSV